MLSEKLRNIRYAAQINNSGESNLKSTIDIKKIQIEMDQTGRAFRELDSKIQEINWLTELKDEAERRNDRSECQPLFVVGFLGKMKTSL